MMILANGKRLKVIAGAVASLSTIVGAAFFVDARYAHAEAVVALIRQARDESRYAAEQLRKQLLEDKVFEINLVPEAKRTNTQRALLERYKAQVGEINARWPSPPSAGVR